MRESWRKQAIADLLNEYHLAGENELEAILLEHVQVSLQFTLVDKENYKQVGSSRIAGCPDLPPSIDWPCTEDGEAYTFLAQINLSELPFLPSDHWPSSGMLYFFLGMDEPAYDVDHQVIYYNGDLTNLALTKLPEGVEEVNADERDFVSYQIIWQPHLSLPDVGEELDVLFEKYEDVYTEIYGVSDALAGGLQTWAGETQLDAYLCRNGMSERLFKYQEHTDDHRQAAKSWQMLFSLSSLSDVNMCWWDAGYLEFLIDVKDLKEGRFNNTYLNLATS
ncbi:DUF1963 domain-containing protein [Lysinibacillus macroides]|uniref:DUF1963 domain-containing protein n=1 Tax=Lysinibacillus macroides TaxID=33935 RepID=A0A0N0CVK9_9BACI|nr:YwqG family protein [Lysinibacillus macroides]KOY81774.1 hypothetical protein ADM90_12705 [Lysinibacillus macroides]QPR67880.1 DUF1963 domain-containing protein [Lysinibacillus macroides]